MVQHFTRFDGIISDLIAAGAALDEMDKVAHLLLTLPRSYEGVITALETLAENQLTLAFVKTRLLDHEVKQQSHQNVNHQKALKTSFILLTPGPSGMSNRFKKNNKWKKNKDWKKNVEEKKKKGNNKQKYKVTNILCDHCGRNNHLKTDCSYYKRMLQNKGKSTTQNPSSNLTNSGSFAFMLGKIQTPQNSSNEVLTFLLDSGATDHIVNRDDVFTSYTTLSPPVSVNVAKSGVCLNATKRGVIHGQTSEGVYGTLENVLYAPDASANLLSVCRIQQSGMTVVFNSKGVQVLNKENQIILSGKQINGLVGVTLKVVKNVVNLTNKILTVSYPNNYNLWHERLGHISPVKFKKIINDKMAEDVHHLSSLDFKTTNLCEGCIFAKQTKLPFAHIKKIKTT